MRKCRWCFQDLDHCFEGNEADKTWLPRWLLKFVRKSDTARHMESWWVQVVRTWSNWLNKPEEK
jgi:hypothetical protein